MRSPTTYALLLVICSAAAVVRLQGLGSESLAPTEIAAINAVDSSALVPPLTGVVSRAARAVGYDELTLRLPGALAGTLAVPAVWWLGETLLGTEAALFAAALMALSPFEVVLARHVGPGPWLTLFSVLSVGLFWRAGRDSFRLGHGCAFAAAAVLAGSASPAMWNVWVGLVLATLAMVINPSARPAVPSRLAVLGVVGVLLGVLTWLNPPAIQPAILRTGVLSQDVGSIVGITSASEALFLLSGALAGLATYRARAAGPLLWWVITAFVGGLLAARFIGHALGTFEASAAEPPFFLLVGAGMSAGLGAVNRRVAVWGQVAARVVIVMLLLAIEVPALAVVARQTTPRWRDSAFIVERNARPDEIIVVMHDRPSFVFYAPDLERRVTPQLPPGRAIEYFGSKSVGWLVVPAATRLYPGWSHIEAWLAHLRPVELSPDASTNILYIGTNGREELLRRTALFDLPTSVLVRGPLLFELLQELGPLPPLLWKVDQIVLSREALALHNPDLLNVLYYLAEHGHGDRAGSLAYRLAMAEPDWPEAQQALAAFRPAQGRAAK